MGWFQRLFRRAPASAPPGSVSARRRGAAAIVGAEHVLVVDGESVDDARDYIPLLERIAAITGGVLRFDRITCFGQPSGRKLMLTQGGRTWGGVLAGNTDWIDEEGLIALLGRVLADLGCASRLHAFREPGWGQELGILFARDDQLPALREAGVELDDDQDSAPEPPEDEVLAADRVIHGLAIRAGASVEYWRDPPFDAMQVTLGPSQEVAGLVLPAGTKVLFTEGGEILCCVIPVAYEAGAQRFAAGTRVPFAGGVWQLDRAEAGYD
jgi:hypothetical protein